ncbi:MAG: type secretion protein [Burkholderiales bacterium]|jgi:type III secretion protein T
MPTSLYLDLQAFLIAMALVTPRVLICLAILPGFGLNVLNGAMKNSAAMAIALPAALPVFYQVQKYPPDLALGCALALKEAALGLMLGALMSIPFWAVHSIGAVFDSQRAAVQVQSSNPAVDRDASAVGAMLIQAVALVMIQAGLFVALARILIESFIPWPAYSLMPPFEPGHFDVVVKRFGELFWHFIVYGAPVIIPLLLIELAFALIGIFASTMQVTSVSAPIKNLAGLFVLLIYWPTLSHYVAGDFSRLLELSSQLLTGSAK